MAGVTQFQDLDESGQNIALATLSTQFTYCEKEIKELESVVTEMDKKLDAISDNLRELRPLNKLVKDVELLKKQDAIRTGGWRMMDKVYLLVIAVIGSAACYLFLQ